MRLLWSSLVVIFAMVFMPSCENTVNTESSTDGDSKERAYLEQVISDMILIGLRGSDSSNIDSKILDHIREDRVGGVILFNKDVMLDMGPRNIYNPSQLKDFISYIQSQSSKDLLMAVDQEGGRVNRLHPDYGFPKSISAQKLGELDDVDSTQFYARRNAENLKALGFNVNFAPVVDLNVNPKSPAIGNIERSFSREANKVVEHSIEWIKIHSNEGILSTIKHFPGHGSAANDTHNGITDVTDTWISEELDPYKSLAKYENDLLFSVMTSHVYHRGYDTLYPATLSENIISDILREEISYKGVVFSDDLQMGALDSMPTINGDLRTIVKRSILADVDILVFGNNLKYDPDLPIKVRDIIIDLVEKNEVSMERMNAIHDRINKMRQRLFKNAENTAPKSTG